MSIPIRPLSPLQRLGHIYDAEFPCVKPLDGFTAGRSYRMQSKVIPMRWVEYRPAATGGERPVQFTGYEYGFLATDDAGRQTWFIEARLGSRVPRLRSLPGRELKIHALVDHFEVPAVADIAQVRPDEYKQALARVLEILPTAKAYQPDDLARLSLLDGAILSWQTGMGKTIGMFTWGLLKVGRTAPVLLISPEDLHRQTSREARRFFGIECQPAAGLDFSQPVPPGFYLVSYTRLGELKIPPDAFTLVMLDEGDKAKKRDSDSGREVRRLNPKYRLIATATPMADRLPDLFWLCSWVTANDPKDDRRFPYAPTQQEARCFAKRYLVQGERIVSALTLPKEQSAEISQLLLLWQLLSSIILRRRMDDCGEAVVKLDHKIVSVPMGEQQRSEYRQVLFDQSLDIGVRLGALRRIAGGGGWPNPKLLETVKLIQRVIKRKEQVLIASDFRDPNDALSELLTEAGIEHVVMDGRTDPQSRGRLAEEFQAGRIPVALIGLKSGAEGLSYPKCNNLILLNYSWEMKKLPQVIGRARRINSERDLTVWSLVTAGSIEARMAQLVVDEKSASADLVLDAVWPTSNSEVSQSGWLDIATAEFSDDQSAVSEDDLLDEWEQIKGSTNTAQLRAPALATRS